MLVDKIYKYKCNVFTFVRHAYGTTTKLNEKKGGKIPSLKMVCVCVRPFKIRNEIFHRQTAFLCRRFVLFFFPHMCVVVTGNGLCPHSTARGNFIFFFFLPLLSSFDAFDQ